MLVCNIQGKQLTLSQHTEEVQNLIIKYWERIMFELGLAENDSIQSKTVALHLERRYSIMIYWENAVFSLDRCRCRQYSSVASLVASEPELRGTELSAGRTGHISWSRPLSLLSVLSLPHQVTNSSWLEHSASLWDSLSPGSAVKG